jgi:hypothetical protein
VVQISARRSSQARNRKQFKRKRPSRKRPRLSRHRHSRRSRRSLQLVPLKSPRLRVSRRLHRRSCVPQNRSVSSAHVVMAMAALGLRAISRAN